MLSQDNETSNNPAQTSIPAYYNASCGNRPNQVRSCPTPAPTSTPMSSQDNETSNNPVQTSIPMSSNKNESSTKEQPTTTLKAQQTGSQVTAQAQRAEQGNRTVNAAWMCLQWQQEEKAHQLKACERLLKKMWANMPFEDQANSDANENLTNADDSGFDDKLEEVSSDMKKTLNDGRNLIEEIEDID